MGAGRLPVRDRGMALGAAGAAGREASRSILRSSLHFSMYTEYSCFLPCRGPQCVPSTETFLASLSGASHRIWLPRLGVELPITVRSGRLCLRHLVLRMWMMSCFLLTVCGIRCEISEFLGPQSSSIGSGAHSLALG